MSKTDGIEGVSARDDFLTQMGGRQFSTVLADPPWQFQNRTGKVAPEHRRLNRYSTMVLDDIKALPVASVCADTAHLYLWVPNALLPGAFNTKATSFGTRCARTAGPMAVVWAFTSATLQS